MRPDPTLGYDLGRELPFERFYNEGRNTKENVSLPDIDMDVPPSFRESLIGYIMETYGNDCVGHIITHSRFKGRGAIKEVFKLLKPTQDYFDVSNQITKKFAEEAKIADDLVEMQKEDPSYGIIRWNIDNIKSIAEYYEQFKEAFDYALRIEEVPRNESVHAAGIIIADQPLSNLFPMVYSEKLDSMVIDVEGADIEYLGGVKFDILGVTALEKVLQIQRMINFKLDEIEFGEFSYSYYD
jgi:DNA polymerase-3 subunit alpha